MITLSLLKKYAHGEPFTVEAVQRQHAAKSLHVPNRVDTGTGIVSSLCHGSSRQALGVLDILW